MTEISESKMDSLPSYSEKKLGYLLSANVLSLKEYGYDRWLSFSHERLLEYTLARYLLRIDRFVDKISRLIQETEAFDPIEGAINFLAEMVDTNVLWQLLHRLTATNKEGKRLACHIIAEFKLVSEEAWSLLESVADEAGSAVELALSEIGAWQPERTATLLEYVIKHEQYWSLVESISFANALLRLCRKHDSFVDLAKQYLKSGVRQKQVGLLALTWLDGYSGWVDLKKIISKFSRSHDKDLRGAVALVTFDLAKHNIQEAVSITKRLAVDTDKEVRRTLARQISKLVSEKSEWLRVLGRMAKSKDWREREVCAGALALALDNSDFPRLESLGRRLSTDQHRQVRRTLAEQLASFNPVRASFNRAVVPMLEAVITRSSHEDITKISFAFHSPSISAQFVKRWHQSISPKLREFSALIWTSDLDDTAIDIAYKFIEDSSSRVRVAFAKNLMSRSFWMDNDNRESVFVIVRKLLENSNSEIRICACWATYRYAEHRRDECISLLLDRVNQDEDDKVMRVAVASLIGLDAQEVTKIRNTIEKRIDGLVCWGELTKLGLDLGELAEDNKLTLDFLLKLSHKHSDSFQHITAVALWFSLLSKDTERLTHYIGILSEMVKRRPSRSHFMLFAWLMMDISEAEADDRFKNSLPAFEELLKTGSDSENCFVRLWATWAAWSCLAYYPTILGDCAANILKKAIEDSEWRIRFACAFYGGALLTDKPKTVGTSFIDLISDLCASLLHDSVQLVRNAAAFSIGQIPETKRRMMAEKYPNVTDFDSYQVRIHSKAEAQEHFTNLLACFYCRSFTWISDELAYEIDALEEDRSKLLFAIWQEKPKETEALVKMWQKHTSVGLQKTANHFFRILKQSM